MQGYIPSTTTERLKDVFKEGKVYVIKKFLCTASRKTYRAVESPFVVQLSRFSIVEARPGGEDAYPFCTYSLTAFDDIPGPGPPTRFFGELYLISLYLIRYVPLF